MTQPDWTAVDAYFEGHLSPSDPILAAALADSDAAGLLTIHVAPAQGKLLQLLARSVGAQRILEIGTLGGYSTIWLARALGQGGRLMTLELNPAHADVAQRNIARAGLSDVVEIRIGAALETLMLLANEGQPSFDFIFIDADKESSADYFDWSLRMARVGTLILVDNVARSGGVIDPSHADSRVQGVRRLVDRVAAEPRVSATVMQTVGVKGYDGLLVCLVTA